MKSKLADKIRSLWRKHRLSLRDERDNKELWYMYISPLSIAAGFIALILVLFIVILSTVAYTPLLEFLPGYRATSRGRCSWRISSGSTRWSASSTR